MREPTRSDVLRRCFFGGARRSVAERIAVVAAWCLALAILAFNALFRILFEDGNLLIRGVCTLVLAAPLLGLYFRAKRSLRTATSSV
jgi:hypothetical protein